MYLQCYCIRDDKAGVFLTPFFMRHIAEALRNVSAVVQDPKSSLCVHSDDYSLHQLGTLDDETGYILVTDGPQFLIKLTQLKKEVQNVKS